MVLDPTDAVTLRYPEKQFVTSKLDLFSDALVLIRYLCAFDYVRELLVTEYNLPAADAKSRASRIVPHVGAVLDFIDQAESGPDHLAFLPIYYSILNMMKVGILLGPHHADLPKNVWHGVRYPTNEKDSQSLVTERVYLKRGGALPLYYKTITNHTITKKEIAISMGSVYPFVRDITFEYRIATSGEAKVAPFKCVLERQQQPVNTIKPLLTFGQQVSEEVLRRAFRKYRIRGLSPPPPGRPQAGVQVTCEGPAVRVGINMGENVRKNVRAFLLFHPEITADGSLTSFLPAATTHLVLPEELYIALMFFHMSSVVRYKPEFLARIRDSVYWPMMLAARRHSLFRMLVVFWSVVTRKTVIFQG